MRVSTRFFHMLDGAWEVLRPFIYQGKFTLRSGRDSDIYLDIKGALLTDESRALISPLLYLVQTLQEQIHCFVGYGYGGALLCSVMSYKGYDSIVFRGENKDYGLKNKPMGHCLVEKPRYVLLEDVVTTEGSVRDCLQAMIDNGLILESERTKVAIYTIVDRREDKDKRLLVHSLFDLNSIKQRLNDEK